MAITDADSKKLSWFINNSFIGHSTPQKPLLWKAQSGQFNVQVVDDLGRSYDHHFEVKYIR